MHGLDKIEARTGLVLGIVAIAAIARVMAVPVFGQGVNFAPMTAIALFSGAYFISPIAVFLVPLLAIFVGDQILYNFFLPEYGAFYEGWYWQYVCYVLVAAVGYRLHNHLRPLNLAAASLGCSVMFFLVTNFGVWFTTGMYPRTWDGLMLCYTLAIPFFGNSVCSDLFYVALMFGSYAYATRRSLQSAQPIRAV